VTASKSVLSASRDGRKGTYRWKALRILKAAALVGGYGRGPRFFTALFRESGTSWRGNDRECLWSRRAARGKGENPDAWADTPQEKQGWPVLRHSVRAVMTTTGAAAPTAASLGTGDAFGLSGAPLDEVASELSTSVLGEGRHPKRRSAR
jgi:hypothetical protein